MATGITAANIAKISEDSCEKIQFVASEQFDYVVGGNYADDEFAIGSVVG